MPDPLPTHLDTPVYLTADAPGIGGLLKQRPEDFLVEEIPAYEPCGQGEHLYLFVEKRNLATLRLVRLLADHFGVRRDAVGVAGLKDKLAVTRQLVSVHAPGKRPEDFPAFRHEGVTVHWADLHTNKLRRGHLKGNRFVIRVRSVSPAAVVHAHRALSTLARLGVPNRVGEQRFGYMLNNHEVGRALLLGDHQRAIDALLGPNPLSPAQQAPARELYREGRYAEALDAFPTWAYTERRVAGALARGAGPKGAVRAIERLQQSFYVTAFQSAVFNDVLNRRLRDGTFARLLPGDLAFKHDNGAVFPVTEEALASPDGGGHGSLDERVARLEVSPSGPMWGADMTRAAGVPDQVELAALEATGVTPDDLARYAKRTFGPAPGSRRPLRVPLLYPDVEGGTDEHGPYIKCVFELPRGSFATTVMREIMKPSSAEAAAALGEEDDAEETR